MLAWLRLIRVALAPTIVWDVLAGLLLAAPALGAADGAAAAGLADPFQTRFLWPLAALLCAYHGGMALNDWADRGLDREAGRRRPLTDGALSPVVAFATAVLLLGASAAILMLVLDGDAQRIGLLLLGTVVVYDLGGQTVREHFGPVLLAMARSISLMLAPIWALGMDGVARAIGPLPVLAYALYFLFLSRLAQREERGLPGMRALPYLMMAAAVPFLLLADGSGSLLVIPAWLALAVWLLRPAWPLRHREWSPEQVQAAVRRGLVAGPTIPAMALLAFPPAAGLGWAVGGPLAALLVVGAARRLVPESPRRPR